MATAWHAEGGGPGCSTAFDARRGDPLLEASDLAICQHSHSILRLSTTNMSSTAVPEVLWAQRSSATEDEKNIIMLTINVPNMTADATKCDLTSTSLKFESTVQGDASKGIEGHKYTFNIDFFENILPAESKQHLTSKCLYLVLRKEKKQEEYWPRLTKEKVRLHNVKTDFDKWVDEDEQDEANEAGDMPFPGGMDMNALMSQMGGGAGGMDFGGMDDDAEDDGDDDETQPPAAEADGASAKIEEAA